MIARRPASHAGPRRFRLAILLAFAVALLAPRAPSFVRDAWAQAGTVQLATSAPAHAEAGEPFVVELRITRDDGAIRAENPSLTPPIGLAASQPSVSIFTNSVTINGVRKSQSEYRARWTIKADDPGTYKIGPPSVTVDGERLRGTTVTVIVDPAGSGSGSSSSPGPSSPPSGGSRLIWPFGTQTDDDEPTSDPAKDLGMPAVPKGKTNFFLRGVVDKSSAVVGEQVTLAFYVYHAVDIDMTDRTDPPLRDFLRIPLVRDPGTATPRTAMVGGRLFTIRLLDRVAIFPLRAGKLSTGTISGRFRGRRIGSRVREESEDIVIDVTEPPMKDRPAGYAVGDVGAFEIEADVKPRDVEVGGSFTVTVKLKGEGNIPATVRMPKVAGVEWLDPEKSVEQVARGGRVGGVRTFRYLGKVTRGGYVELGKVDLPFWDPTKKEYATPSADLGGLRVEGKTITPPPSASASAGPAGKKDDPLSQLPDARSTLSPYAPSRAERVPVLPLGLALVAPPLLVAFLFGGLGAARAARKRADEKRDAPATRVKEALDEARAADLEGGEKAVASAVERAVHASIEAHTGVRARGVLLRDLRSELTAAGVSEAVAERAAGVLEDAESLRFDPGADAAKRSGLVERARDLVRALEKDAARRRDAA